MTTKTYRQMLASIRWVHFKAALRQSLGLMFISCAVLPIALIAYINDSTIGWVIAIWLVMFVPIITALYLLTKGVVEAYRCGAKSEEFIRRFHAAMVDTGDVRH